MSRSGIGRWLLFAFMAFNVCALAYTGRSCLRESAAQDLI